MTLYNVTIPDVDADDWQSIFDVLMARTSWTIEKARKVAAFAKQVIDLTDEHCAIEDRKASAMNGVVMGERTSSSRTGAFDTFPCPKRS
jgi:hypothetical protein